VNSAIASSPNTVTWIARSIAMRRSTRRSRRTSPRAGRWISSRDSTSFRVACSGRGRAIQSSQRRHRCHRRSSISRTKMWSWAVTSAASVPTSSCPSRAQTTNSYRSEGLKDFGTNHSYRSEVHLRRPMESRPALEFIARRGLESGERTPPSAGLRPFGNSISTPRSPRCLVFVAVRRSVHDHGLP
jgi:hypothetical protein